VKKIGCPCARKIIILFADTIITARGIAILKGCSNQNSIGITRKTEAKAISSLGVGCFQIGLLGPGCARSDKDIGSAGIGRSIISLIAVDSGGRAIFRSH